MFLFLPWPGNQFPTLPLCQDSVDIVSNSPDWDRRRLLSAVVRPCQLLECSPTTPTTKISCSPPGFWMTSRSPSPLGSECGRWLGMTMTEASWRCGLSIYYLSTIYLLSTNIYIATVCLVYSPKISIYIKHWRMGGKWSFMRQEYLIDYSMLGQINWFSLLHPLLSGP